MLFPFSATGTGEKSNHKSSFSLLRGFSLLEDSQNIEVNYSKILEKEISSSPQKDTVGSLCSSLSKHSSQI